MENEALVSLNLPLISICIPVFNEQENILPLHARLVDLANLMKHKCQFEYVFTDNCSEDQTWKLIQSLAKEDSRVRGVRFSRNIGFQNSIRFNYLYAKGHAAIELDADLQDPPELINQFFEAWRKGSKIVSGVRVQRDEKYGVRKLRDIGYRVINRLSDRQIQEGVGDFRLIDREVIELIRKVRTPNPYLRGIISEFGFEETLIEYSRSKRTAGESKFGFLSVIKLGVTAVLNHSGFMLRIANITAFCSGATAFFLSVYFVASKILNPQSPQGYTSLAVLISLGFGANALLLGMMGSYIRKIYFILSDEEKFVVSERL